LLLGFMRMVWWICFGLDFFLLVLILIHLSCVGLPLSLSKYLQSNKYLGRFKHPDNIHPPTLFCQHGRSQPLDLVRRNDKSPLHPKSQSINRVITIYKKLK